MRQVLLRFAAVAVLIGSPLQAQPVSAQEADTSPHKVHFVATNDHIKLEVLDWGGTGRPLIFLAGLGGTAHVFDKFALQFRGKHHVYGITRRGFGASDKPAPATDNYAADRLGDDVLTVITALKLDRPVLAGHSIAGEEMSSIGTRHPERIAGLVYLDAGYAYGFYAPGNLIPLGSNLTIDANDINRKQRQASMAGITPQAAALLDDLNRTSLPQLKTDLAATRRAMRDMGKFLPDSGSPP
ncbi:MAG TPA: alpha/beta hydrolase, partial [Rhizomicrobium sp.]|nr:alpha/beta hydrolase [Rhizomicrobium sp.]